MKKETRIYDMSRDSDVVFYNDLSPKQNLISAHMLQSKMWSQLHDTELRKRFESSIIEGNKTLAIGDLCVMIF